MKIDKIKVLIIISTILLITEISLFIYHTSYFKKTIKLNLKNKYLSETIIKYSDKYKFDPIFIQSIIKAESNYNKYAKSYTNAYGYMQLKKSTAIFILNKNGYIKLSRKIKKDKNTIYETDVNIMTGCMYLKWIKDNKNIEDWIDLMAYYNSGKSDIIVGSYLIKIKRFCKDKIKI